MLGEDLKSCRDALTSKDHDNLHLLERTNIDLQVQNSIVPTAYNLARFKVSGHLPTLQVNLSDTKYKTLMRLIDIAVPHFDDDASGKQPDRPTLDTGGVFRLPTGLFGPSQPDYEVGETLDTKDSQQSVAAAPEQDDEFFEADQGNSQVRSCDLPCQRFTHHRS